MLSACLLALAILLAGPLLLGALSSLPAVVTVANAGCYASTAIAQLGAEPCYVDVEPERLTLAARVPLGWIVRLAAALLSIVAVLGLMARRRAAGARRGPTWDCGYALPTPRMQYTASSFARTIIQLFGSVLRPREQPPEVTGLFPPTTPCWTG